jgi:hypothetical protein
MAKLNLKKIKAKATEIKKQEKERKDKKSDESAFLNKLPVGSIEVRLLPPWSSSGDLAKEIYTHFGLPPGNTTVIDIEKTHPKLGLPNPIDEVLEDFKDDLDVSRLWSKATPKINVYIPESDINEECEDLSDNLMGKVKIISPSSGTYNQIVKKISNPRIGDITDPDDGYNLTIEKTVGKKWQDTRYSVELAPPQGPIHEDPDEQERILEKTWDLDKMFPAPDDAKIAEIHTAAKALRKHLEKQLREIGGVPTRRKRTSKPAEEELEDAEEPEDVAEEEEEEEEAPKAKKKKKRRKAAVEDDGDYSDPPFPAREVTEEPSTTKKSVTSSSKKTSNKTTSKRKKPDCYGDADIYKIDDDQFNVCNDCQWEVPCERTQKKAGTFCYIE